MSIHLNNNLQSQAIPLLILERGDLISNQRSCLSKSTISDYLPVQKDISKEVINEQVNM